MSKLQNALENKFLMSRYIPNLFMLRIVVGFLFSVLFFVFFFNLLESRSWDSQNLNSTINNEAV